ncbi:PpiC-type peptidyl-prolyl cis-trans isomerase [Candidatus Koribacter versatilis Ellin345]|uniref:Periplasmic chaperone PpiD n=1 Tax=Koribacter versatilis (strain Ellin345) TaxID=204669 RepID=Q1IMY4_KORVE|nr:peptidyl-prolyl cis-trans isomerase [Candidatus Koribacter versatilis]ABF41766.1 PpiC-type peptidyl-prolyl cis-trans isomerase [Candidatus Koribacter versatilis Ellin345]
MIRFLQTPSKTKKIVLGGLLTVICVMMVVTLIPGGGIFGFGDTTVTGDSDLAKVDGEAITAADASKAAQNMAQQQRYPAQFVPFLMPQAVEMLIKQKAVLDEAHRMGLNVSDEELRAVLHKGQFGEILFPKGNYVGDDAYQNFVQSQFSMTVPQFELELKKSIEIQKLRGVVEASATVADADIDNLVRQQQTKVKFDYASLSLADIEKGINPSDAEMKAWYEAHKDQFKDSLPEKRKIKYVSVIGSKLPGVQPSDADIQKYYNDHKTEFTIPQTATVQHILVMVPQGADAKTDAAAKAKAEDYLKQARGGANFGELAKKYSDDKGTGDSTLEVTPQGNLVKEFKDASLAGKTGDILGPVKTQFGYHIIKIQKNEPAGARSLDEVKSQIAIVMGGQKAADAAQKAADNLRNSARVQGLDKAAAAAGDTVETTDFVTQSSLLPGIGQAPQFMNAVFKANAKSGADVAPITGGYAVYEVTDVQPPATPTFEQAKAQVEQQFKAGKAQTLIVQKAQELADRARTEHDLKKAAKEAGVTVKTSEMVTQSSQVPDVGSLSGPSFTAVFAGKTGDIIGPVQGGRNAIVIAVVEKQEPTADEMTKGKEEARQQLLAKKKDEVLEIYVSNLIASMEKSGKIKRNKKAIERLSQGAGLGSSQGE